MKPEKPLSVVLSIARRDGKIALIKRRRGDYKGLWALPGGKIEPSEHIDSAAVRELEEESGIKADFKEYLGLVSENLVEQEKHVNHFLLHLCRVEPEETEINSGEEGQVKWINLHDIDQLEEEIVPSDLEMIERIVVPGNKGYFNCRMRKTGSGHQIESFEKLTGL